MTNNVKYSIKNAYKMGNKLEKDGNLLGAELFHSLPLIENKKKFKRRLVKEI